MESTPGHESVGEKASERLDTSCRINVHSKRSRLCDPDGVSAKALIDGLVLAGVLRDDSAKSVSEVRFTQEIGEDETIVDVIFEDVMREMGG